MPLTFFMRVGKGFIEKVPAAVWNDPTFDGVIAAIAGKSIEELAAARRGRRLTSGG